MTKVLAITERELKAYFVSPLAYVVGALFLFGTGLLFALTVLNPIGPEASLRFLHSNITVIFLFVIPALTMRLLAEEQKTGTLEVLLTNPVRDVEVVVGKYLATTLYLLVLLAVTLYYALLVFMFGNPDVGPMVSGYLGVFLAGAALMAIGLFFSSLTSNQIVAALGTFFAVLFMWLSEPLGQLFPGPIGDALGYLSIAGHLGDTGRGIIDTRDIVFFLSLVATFLFLTVVSLQTRRWR